MGGNVGMASVVHPVERRKFTIAELRRICAFADDFVLIGSYAQQWARLGNAVPPVMMMRISAAVRDGVLSKCCNFIAAGRQDEEAAEDPAGAAGGVGGQVVLADPQDGPPGPAEAGTVAPIAPEVAGELGDPVPKVRRRKTTARRARVPEAPVDEHGQPSARE